VQDVLLSSLSDALRDFAQQQGLEVATAEEYLAMDAGLTTYEAHSDAQLVTMVLGKDDDELADAVADSVVECSDDENDLPAVEGDTLVKPPPTWEEACAAGDVLLHYLYYKGGLKDEVAVKMSGLFEKVKAHQCTRSVKRQHTLLEYMPLMQPASEGV
jgi:hypothetical protein